MVLVLAALVAGGARAQGLQTDPQPDGAARGTPSAAPLPTFEEVVKNETRHWSLVLPPGWTLAPQETVDAIDAEMTKLMPTKGFRCVAVLWADEARGTSGPHIQVHAVTADSSGTTLDEMEKSLGDAREIASQRQRERDAAGVKVSQAEETPPTLDRERLRIVSSGHLVVPGAAGLDGAVGVARKIRFTSTGMIGKREVTKLLLYAPDAEFDARVPEYEAVLASFAYEDGWGYDAAKVKPAATRTTGYPPGVGALIAVGLIVVAVKLVWRRKKKPVV
jgi:hypothetical protein